MRKILFTILLLAPLLIFGQEKNNTKKEKVNATSGATWSEAPKTVLKGTISGRIIDQKTNEYVEYTNITISSIEQNKTLEGTISDKNGKFSFKEIEVGKYKLSISFIGYKTKEIEFETSNKKPNYKFKKIILEASSKQISEIEIKEEKAIYENRIDKIIYNAENDLNDSEDDATDVLRKAPLLSVDLDGNISLRGSRNIKFLVNGKASSFFSSDVATALQMIPADQIKSVEVITSPGAKYDGEGDAGIVNIITKKTIIDGYKATLNGSIGTKVNRDGLNLSIGKGKFGLSARAGMHYTWPGRIGTNSYTRHDWNEDSTIINTLEQYGTSENYYNGYRGSVSAFYDINHYNSINSSLRFGGRTNPFISTDSIKYTNRENDSLSYDRINIVDKTDRTLNMEWTTDYTKKFANNEDRELSFAFQIGGDINDGNTDINEDGRNLYNQNDEKVIEETIQIDYTHPFGSNKLEVGGKIINRDREIVYSNQGSFTSSEQFDYNQKVASSYLSTEFNLPYGLGLKAGLRHELTNVSGNWKSNQTPEFEKSYNNFLPNVVFSKSFSPIQSLKLSFSQRISRPSVRHINPNENRLDNRNITIGNPNLKPTITEQLELGFNSFGKVTQGSYQLYYKHSTDVIESFLEISGDTSISTYKNIGESKQIGASYFGSIRIKKLSIRGSINLYSYKAKDTAFFNNEWSPSVILYNYHMGGNYDLGNNWKAEAFGFFMSPSQTIQGSTTTFSMMSFGIKKTFKNKRGSLGFRIIEPFKKNKDFSSDLVGDNFSQYSNRSIPFRSFGISFKYTFGKLNFKSKSGNTKIKNDDIQQEQSGEQ